jgi:hypothetical protein
VSVAGRVGGRRGRSARVGGRVILAATALALSACGLNVQSPDLFLLTRTGPGAKLTLDVGDGGTMRCDGGHTRNISSARLIAARDLADSLGTDAQHNLTLPVRPDSIYRFQIALQQGTIRFSDRDIQHHPDLAQAVLFATQAAQQVCGLPG